ncbi:MAG: hypothetical protein NWE89_04280 [Candidatus Bathyarchaeota archaeon]|nr:hypothetical protein [Candidatus Bathyarchaeota archaeon]
MKNRSLLFFLIFISLLPNVPVSSTSITFNQVDSPWDVSFPWEPLSFSVEIVDGEKEVSNITLLYTTEPKENLNFIHVPMNLVKGNSYSGLWNYSLDGFGANTSLYYAYQINYTKGYSQSPVPDLENAYLRKIYYPKNTIINVNSFRIIEINPIKLTADIEINVHIITGSILEEISIQIGNRVRDGYLSSLEYVNIPVIQGWRYNYIDTIKVNDLKLTGNAFEYPFDDYYLDIFLRSYYYDASKFMIPESSVNIYEPSNHVWSMEPTKLTIKDNEVNGYFQISRLGQNSRFVLFPLLICSFLLGSSLLIDNKYDLRIRMSLYISSIFFMLKTSNDIRNYVPTRTLGISFAENAYLFVSIFFGIYIISTILGYYLYNIKQNEAFPRQFDLISVILSTLIFIFYPILNLYSTNYTLYNMIPTFWMRILFIFSISWGLMIQRLKENVSSFQTKITDYIIHESNRD